MKNEYEKTYKQMKEKYSKIFLEGRRKNIDDRNYWYHGSKIRITQFSDEFVGRGNDQNGPGIYFSNSKQESKKYYTENGGYIHTVKLNIKKLVSTIKPASVLELRRLIQMSPRYEERLLDWDENPRIALQMALEVIQENGNAKDEFLEIHSSFYSGDSVRFVRNMVLLGYDGFIIEHEPNRNEFTDVKELKHAIIYNPSIIEIINIEEIF